MSLTNFLVANKKMSDSINVCIIIYSKDYVKYFTFNLLSTNKDDLK